MFYGLFVIILTILVIWLVCYVTIQVAEWDTWCGLHSDTGLQLLRWWGIRILYIITFPILLVLMVIGVYGVASATRDFLKK